MKTNLILLGTAAVLALPLSLRADDGTKPKTATRSVANAMRTVSAKQTPVVVRSNREVFYITNQVVTGSHIPVVVTRYKGHNITSSPLVSYDQSDISTTGALDVGSALVTRDPAITFGRGR